MCLRSLSTTARATKARHIPPSDITEQLLKLKPTVAPEDVQHILARHELDRESVGWTMQELKDHKRHDLVALLASGMLKTSGAKVGRREITTGIGASARVKNWRLATHLFDSMPKAKVDANVISYNAIISACEKGGQWQRAVHLFDSMRNAKVKADVISYNATISAYEKGGQWQLAVQLFDSMSKAKVDADVISFSATISACEKGGQWQLAAHLLDCMHVVKVNADVIIYNATISACEKGLQWQLAVHLFDSMCKAKVDADVISFNATISACEKGGQWQLAVELFDNIHKTKLGADVISYNTTISACEKGGQWQLAVHLLDRMLKAKVDANVISYNATISASEKGGQWQLAVHLFDLMGKARVNATFSSYNAVLEAASSEAPGQGYELFLQARMSGLYGHLLKKGPAVLDVHDMSTGAGWIAVRWWLLEVLPPLLSSKQPRCCIIITGWGKSRAIWQKSDVQTGIQDNLKSHGIAAEVQRMNPGRLELHLTTWDLAAFRGKLEMQKSASQLHLPS